VKSRFSIEDSHCIEAHQLGLPLGVYTLKLSHIRFLLWIYVLIALVGVVILVAAILNGLQSLGFFPVLLGGSYALLLGGMQLFIRVPQLRRQHVVVCEHGLLQVDRVLGKNRMEWTYWTDILSASERMSGIDYTILCQGSKEITLTPLNPWLC